MGKLQTFFKEIKKASKGHRIRSLGIEFGSSSIKAVQFVQDRGRIKLDNYGEIELGPLAEKSIGTAANLDVNNLGKAITALFQNVRLENPDAVVVAIPLSASLVIPLTIESSNEDRLEAIVKREIEDKVPVPLSDVYIDWQIVDKKVINNSTEEITDESQSAKVATVNETGGTNKTSYSILCFVINKDIINTYTSVINNLGYEIEYFELEIYSVLRSAVNSEVDVATIVDIGARYTKIYVYKDGRVLTAIKKLQGGIDFTESIKNLLRVDFAKAEELKRSLHLEEISNSKVADVVKSQIDKIVIPIKQARSEFGVPDDSPIYLCGGGSLLFGLPEYMANQLETNLIICQPFVNAEAPDFLDKLLVETGPEYAVAAGLSLKYINNI